MVDIAYDLLFEKKIKKIKVEKENKIVFLDLYHKDEQ